MQLYAEEQWISSLTLFAYVVSTICSTIFKGQIGPRYPETYMCHLYFISWRMNWRIFQKYIIRIFHFTNTLISTEYVIFGHFQHSCAVLTTYSHFSRTTWSTWGPDKFFWVCDKTWVATSFRWIYQAASLALYIYISYQLLYLIKNYYAFVLFLSPDWLIFCHMIIPLFFVTWLSPH